MATLVRGVRWVAAACLFAVGAPIALLLLLLYLGAAVVLGLLLSVFFVMILAGFIGPVSNPVQWLVAIPVVAGCVILGGWFWSEKLGIRPLFPRRAGDSHGSARFTWSFPVAGNLRGYLEAFTGYGESLIDYNHRATYLGVGVSLLDWY